TTEHRARSPFAIDAGAAPSDFACIPARPVAPGDRRRDPVAARNRKEPRASRADTAARSTGGHVSRSPDDEDLLQDLQDSLAAAVQPAELGAELRDRMRQHTLELAREQPPEGTRTLREAAAVWIEIAPFVEVRELRRDEVAGTHTSLMRMRP